MKALVEAGADLDVTDEVEEMYFLCIQEAFLSGKLYCCPLALEYF